ncbi:hypothetical protein YWS52_09770 [Chitiniphilus shinanonensis]
MSAAASGRVRKGMRITNISLIVVFVVPPAGRTWSGTGTVRAQVTLHCRETEHAVIVGNNKRFRQDARLKRWGKATSVDTKGKATSVDTESGENTENTEEKPPPTMNGG